MRKERQLAPPPPPRGEIDIAERQFGGGCSTRFGRGAAFPRNAASITLARHVPAVVANAIAQARDPQAANQPITLTMMLNLTDQAGFKAFEASLQDPSSPNYCHPVSGAEITQRFGPSQEAYNTVLGYLQQSGSSWWRDPTIAARLWCAAHARKPRRRSR